MSLHPRDGARLLLELIEARPEGGATYRGALFTTSARRDFLVAIDASGGVSLTEDSSAVPITSDAPQASRAADLLRAIARTIARHVLAEPPPPRWPRRVLRWRRL